MLMTESQINSLRSQDAKDLAIRLQEQLKTKEMQPISAGEVQLRELEYELKLKEAEAEDRRQREEHAERMRELEAEIERQKVKQSEAEAKAALVREEQGRLVDKVEGAKESLSIQLEKATREVNLKVETLDADFKSKTEELNSQRKELEEKRDELQTEIADLADMKKTAQEIKQLREQLESQQSENQRQLLQLDEQFKIVEFEKLQKINAVKREQEVQISELNTQHKKDIMQANQQAAKDILIKVGMMPVKRKDWEKMKKELDEKKQLADTEVQEIRKNAKEEFRKEFNITVAEALDVTELYYRQRSLDDEAVTLRSTVDKLETEIQRMRSHIEHEPSRISAAVEAAKVQVSNNIEQTGKR